MRFILITISLLSLWIGQLNAQYTKLFSEDFETVTLPDSTQYSGNGYHGKSNTLFTNGLYSDSLTIGLGADTSIMTTSIFSTSGYPYLYLDFNHICKIDVFDEAYIEVSNNGGVNWTRLTSIHYRGNSQFSNQGSKFTAASYVNEWMAGNAVIPNNSWWKAERFDISSLVGNASSVKIRFILKRSGMVMPFTDNYAWFIDQIEVTGSAYEFYKPIITKLAPTQDTIKSNQPYEIIAQITDDTGIDTAYVAYKLNGGIIDTIPMVLISPDTFKAIIPFYGYGRTIIYDIVAIDNSPNKNIRINEDQKPYHIYAKYLNETIVELSGAGTSNVNNGPIYLGTNTTFKYSKFVYLFTMAELQAAGMPANGQIKQVAWYKTTGNGTNGNASFKIIMLNSSNTSYQSGTITFPYATVTAGSTTVYENLQYQVPSYTGWIDFNTTPFTYTGSSLEIGTEWDISAASAPIGGPLEWRMNNSFNSGRTLGAGGTTPVLNVAGFWYGGIVRADIRMVVETPYDLNHDAGVVEITEPTTGVNANSDFELKVKIKNYGLDSLQNITIKWAVNGNYTGQKISNPALLHDSVSNEILLDTLNLSFGTYHLSVWTENPNNQSDMDISNDTLRFSFASCNGALNGTYTLGNTGADFSNLGEVATALAHCGVSGPVTINVQPGQYFGNAVFNTIPGSSATNFVKITASNGDSSSVVFYNNAYGINDNYIVRLINVNNLQFDKLTFNANSATHCKVFDLKQNCSQITLTSSVLVGATANLYDDEQSLFVALKGSVDSSILIKNNYFKNGFNGLVIKGYSSDTLLSNIVIEKNSFENQNLVAADLAAIDALIFKSNFIYTTSQLIVPQGVNLNTIKNKWRFERNTIQYLQAVRGISIWHCNSSFGNEGIIANNMISIGGNYINAIIDIYNGTAIKFYNNSVLKYGFSTGNVVNINTFPANATTDSLYFVNNIFTNKVNTGNIYSLSYALGNRNIKFNYNNYLNHSSYFGANGTTNIGTFNQWKSIIQQDTNSIYEDPSFASNLDLHIANYSLKGLGKNLAEINFDHDGKPRGIPPTIGAHELFNLNNDIQVLAILTPLTSCGLDSSESIVVRLKNNGQNIINTGFNLYYKVNSNNHVVETINQSIAVGGILDYTFNTTANFNVTSLKKDSIFELKVWNTYSLDEFVYNDTILQYINSGYKPTAPTANSFSTNYGTSTSIFATATDTLFWFLNDSTNQVSGMGKYFNTPVLFDTTDFYTASRNLIGMQCFSDRTTVTVNVINFPNSDAGIVGLNSPSTNSVIAGVKTPLIATIKNFGLQTLTSAKILYSINGVIQDSIAWTGSLTQNNTSQQLIDSLQLSPGFYTIKIWTRNPNNAPDQFLNNDTLTLTISACMSGIYTIGTSGVYNYNSVAAAINDLTSGGICGDVTFMIADGIYNGTFDIPAIDGAGPNAWVKFKSTSGDSSAVTLIHTITGSQTSAFQMTGSSYIAFENIGFEALTTTTEARLMEITNSAHHLKFDNCKFVGIPAPSISNKYAVIYSNSGSCSFLQFNNNYIINGSNSIYLYGATALYAKGNIINGNYCTKFVSSPIIGSYQDSIQIIRNTCFMNTSATSTNGIYAYRCSNHVEISNNYVDISSSTAGSGIYISYYAGSQYDKILVYNNMVIVPAVATTSYGLNITTCTGLNVYFNTVKVNGTGVNGRTVYLNNVNLLDFRNNIIQSQNSMVYYFNGTNTFDYFDYNAVHNTGTYFAYYGGVNKFTFNDFKTASNLDENSIFVNPPFISTTDLHLSNGELSAKGVYIAQVTHDIDGEIRNQYPTIGADEVPLASKDAAITAVLTPASSAFEFDSITPKVILCNRGLDTIQSLTISYTINSQSPVNYSWTGSLALFQCDTVALPYFISPAGNINFCVSAILVGDTNTINNQICKAFSSQPAVDLEVLEIIPMSEGCNLSVDTLKLKVKNSGISAINTNLSISYRIEGSSLVNTETKLLNLNVNGIDTLSFTNPINLFTTQDTLFKISAWAKLTNDNVDANDTAKTTIQSYASPSSPIANHDTISYATSSVLTASSANGTFIKWFNDEYGGTAINTGNSYTTPIMYNHDTLWLESWRNPVTDTLKLGQSITTNSATTFPTPYGGYSYGNKEQYLIRSSELSYLNGSKSLTSISFNVQSLNSCPSLTNYEIKIGHSTNNNMTGFISGLTTVYSTPLYQPIAGKNTHLFQIPFVWDGVSNIVIEVCFNNGNYISNGNASVENSVTSFVSVSRFSGNYGTVCSSPGSFSLGGVRPNIILGFNDDGCPSLREPLSVYISNQTTHDVGITKILSPNSDTSLTSSETLQVVVRNFGSMSQSNIPVNYQINGGQIITEIVAGPLASGDSLIYNFSTTLNLSIPGKTYHFSAFTTLSNDSILFNDTLSKSITHLLPVNCISRSTDGTQLNIGEVTISNWSFNSINLISGYSDFSVVAPSLIFPQGSSNPLSISTFLPIGGSSSNPAYAKIWIDFNHNAVFDTNEIVYGGSLVGGSLALGTINIPTGLQAGYAKMRIVVQRYGSATSTLPCGFYQFGETEDYIVQILPQPSCEVGIIQISKPENTAISGTNQPVWIKLQNYGTDTLFPNNLNITYNFNNQTFDTLHYNKTLTPLQIDSVVMTPIIIAPGNNSLVVNLNLPCDSMNNNNTFTKNIYGIYQENLSYFNDFEGINTWYNAYSSIWQKGYPAGDSIVSTPTGGSNVWMTILNAPYSNSTSASLVSPLFDLSYLTNADTAMLSFDYSIFSELNQDGGNVEYSFDYGVTWSNLGYIGDPLATNWYNTNINGVHKWSGNINWQTASYKLDPAVFNASQVMFRFKFDSNNSGINLDGWAIDNFKIQIPILPSDAGISAIITPNDSTEHGSSISVKVRIKNYGSQILTSIPLAYSVNNLTPVVETWNGSLNPQDSVDYSFNTKFISPQYNYSICAYTQVLGDYYNFNDQACANIATKQAKYDVGITAIESPTDTTNSAKLTISVWVKNFGTMAASNFPIELHISQQFITSEIITSPIAPNDSLLFTFALTPNNIQGSLSICAKTIWTNDSIESNDELCKNVFGTVGLQHQLSEPVLLKVIPNPANDFAVLELISNQSGMSLIRILDPSGKVIISQEHAIHVGQNRIKLETNQISEGIYLIELRLNNHKQSTRLVIIR